MRRYLQFDSAGRPVNKTKFKFKKNMSILREMAKKNFKSQYRNSLLGVLWTVLHPLLNMAVLALVFSQIFGNRGVGCYPVYLLCGTLIFNTMRQISSQSLSSVVSQSGLVKKVNVSYSIFPISTAITGLINLALSFIALIIVMLVLRQTFYWTMLLTITIIPALILFSLGIGFALACLFVFFRDVKHLYEIFLTLWTYLTPMFYSLDILKPGFISKVINLNPMTHFVTMFRNMIQNGAVPCIQEYLICYGWGILLFIIGYSLFKLNQRKYILYI